MADQDQLSYDDLLALHQTYQQLKAAGDPRADKVGQYVSAQGRGLVASGELQKQAQEHAGFWSALGSDLKGLLTPSGTAPYPGVDVEGKQRLAEQGAAEDQARKAAGYSTAYRIAAPVAGVVANVPGMEQAAAQGDAAGVLGHAAAGVAPIVAGEVVKAGAPKVATAVENTGTGVAERMYRSALKPRTTMPIEQSAAAVQTGLENKVPVSPKGLEILSGLIDDLNGKVNDQIQTNPSATISRDAATKPVGQTFDRFSKQVNATKDLNDIAKSVEDYRNANPLNIPASKAQAMKVGTYQQVGSKYGIQSDAAIEAQKALARGLKEELETQFPEIKSLNASEGKLLDLQPLLERAVGRTMNHQLLGIGTPMAAAAGEAVTGSAKMGGIIGAVKGMLDSAPIKSRLASAIYWGAKRAGSPITQAGAEAKVAGYVDALRAGALASASTRDQSATQESPQ